ncbi:MAG: hypothetical protein LIO71_01915 [Ruminococcus sp.]|nr:hypothetical protein [Ruminococcus sp.]MCD7799642.1 hypothetical protein [Ruminococcus sp.]
MPIIISEIKSSLGESKGIILEKAIKRLKLSQKEVASIEIHKTSLDARNRDDIHFVNSVYVELNDVHKEEYICNKNRFCTYVTHSGFNPIKATNNFMGRPLIVGFGPAGLFCALALAENGYKPIVLERGDCIENRVDSVSNFWNGKQFSEDTNVQFGEGGAGTFSDGKLTTRIKDSLCRYVFERLVEFGASQDILYKAKAHIGTDKLRGIVKNIRNRIIQLGGEVYFNSKMVDFNLHNGIITSVRTKDLEFYPCAVILAVGHSARDTFELLLNKEIFVEPKPFSIGVRIEHSRQSVDYSLYGEHAGNPLLPVGEYQLSHRLKDGRAVYTFCMCPGGYVVPSSSEVGGVVTNGMSEYARDGKNSNSAMVVSVSTKDYGSHPIDGINFARHIEQTAFKIAGSNYKAPATSVRGFLNGRADITSTIEPTYARGIVPCNLNDVFPNFVIDMLNLGLNVFSKKMLCFADQDAIMTAPETRTSSPIRITRDLKTLNSISVDNLYPCGEGAGYSGGITSSAVDGLRVALKVMERFSCE